MLNGIIGSEYSHEFESFICIDCDRRICGIGLTGLLILPLLESPALVSLCRKLYGNTLVRVVNSLLERILVVEYRLAAVIGASYLSVSFCGRINEHSLIRRRLELRERSELDIQQLILEVLIVLGFFICFLPCSDIIIVFFGINKCILIGYTVHCFVGNVSFELVNIKEIRSYKAVGFSVRALLKNVFLFAEREAVTFVCSSNVPCAISECSVNIEYSCTAVIIYRAHNKLFTTVHIGIYDSIAGILRSKASRWEIPHSAELHYLIL